MCIICECADAGESFLDAYDTTRRYLKRATQLMLDCSKVAVTPEARKAYDATHKRMRRLMRDLNRIEHTRELHHMKIESL